MSKDLLYKESLPVQKIGLISFKFSNAGIIGWDRPISMAKEVLNKHGFKIYLYIKVFYNQSRYE